MTSQSSTFRPKLNDQEYMELVFENGQILAKGQRSNVSLQNQRRNSIMDLYESEYNEDFKKSIHGCGGGSIEFIPPDEQSVVAERSVESGFDSSSTDFSEDSEGSMYLSSSRDDESDDARPQVPARTIKALVKRKRSTEVYNSPERKQRNDINKKMRTLQDLLPNSHEGDNESLLDEAINYTTNLQLQVQMMKMGNRFVTPSMMLLTGPLYSQMDLAMGMGMQIGAPQFLPAPVLGAGLPGINSSANMLRFLNHPGIMPMQNSPLFTPTENRFPQSVPVPPSSAALPNQMPNPISLSNLDEYTRNQGSLADGGFSLVKNLEDREQMK